MDALLDAQIPQTSTIKRNPVTLNVTYDGEPKFKAIEGTKLEFAVNTSFSVIKLEKKYYCCDQAVWYAAAGPKGPWQVADKVPDEIYGIPPSNPHYNVTYVHVYESTPEVVYVGYYPGYVHSYMYGGCVIYGTGWYYPPYVSPYAYYPYFPTWGFGVGWNPWTGWSIGIGWGYGPFHITFGFGGYGGWYGGWHGGWYGPGYHPPHWGHYPGRPGAPGGIGGVGGPPSATNPIAGQPGRGQATPYNNNLYSNPKNTSRNAAASRDKGGQAANRVGGGANNVYAAPNGDVYRRNNDGSWQQRGSNGSWLNSPSGTGAKAGSGAGVSTRPSTGSSAGSSGLTRDYQSRTRGNTRASSYSGSRGGGGGRRR
jgi:hypothetical protein